MANIKPGDTLSVYPRARYGGWINYVQSVKIDVYTARVQEGEGYQRDVLMSSISFLIHLSTIRLLPFLFEVLLCAWCYILCLKMQVCSFVAL